ncbi:MAG TPA: hypothetical protein VFM98_02525, partial [Ramlibacter sp.]|uniref:hypothetical protein n=1 Tax=Ramlibacter sp. TaxID=1917967 RepID=UPI002D7E9B47
CAAEVPWPVSPPGPVIAPAPAAPPAPAPAPAPAAAPAAAAPAPPNTPAALEIAVGYAERVRALPAAELAQEVQRLGDNTYSPLRGIQLALALAQTRTAANTARAQAILQRVQADPGSEPQGLQSFARWLAAQLAEQRRNEEAAERQAQQLRDAQRRIDQLNERLEALRAIERSLPGPKPTTPPAHGAPPAR